MTDLDLDVYTPADQHGDDVDLSEAVSGIRGATSRPQIRTIPTAQISEFNINSGSDKVKLHELMGSLTASASSGQLKKQLRSVYKRQKVLDKPLSRFEQSTITRTVAYEQTTKEVSKWEPVVEQHKKAEQLEFPLQKPKLKVHTGHELSRKIQPFTPLEKEIAILLHGSENVLPEKSGLTKAEQRALQAMDIDEARRRRAELQKHRALLSYKEARAKRQKKIKSKQFHRILNKERRKIESKSLDEMKEKDPEQLKDKIEKADKSRIEERMSLKHHGGSKKMKSKMIYAKFDKDARLEVNDMLQKSRELRQKTAAIESDSEGEAVPDPVVIEEEGQKRFSPWTGSALSGQSNPWLKPTTDKVKPSEYARPEAVVAKHEDVPDEDEDVDDPADDDTTLPVTSANTEVETYVIGDVETKENDANKEFEEEVEEEEEEEEIVPTETKKKRKGNKTAKSPVPLRDTAIEEDSDENEERDEIDDIFENAADKSKTKKGKSKNKKADKGSKSVTKDTDVKLTKRKAKKRKSAPEDDNSIKSQKLKKKAKSDGAAEDNKLKKSRKRPAADEENQSENVDDSGLTISTERKRTLQDMDQLAEKSAEDSMVLGKKTKRAKKAKKKKANESDDLTSQAPNIYANNSIDPSDFLTASTTTDLRSSSAPLVAESETNNDDVTQHELIAEAFADDDVMDAFSKEKSEIEDRDKPKAVDLALPGWGCWGGQHLAVPRRKRRRFRIKPPPSAPRKDANLKNVVISETKDTSVAKHQVSWLPRTYKNVHQFESSIRAPLGRTWNPETSFRDLTKPKVITHLGTVIDPMDESLKFDKQKTKGAPDVKQRKKR